MRTPYDGIGKTEELKNNLTGYWSRRIDETNRLVYAAGYTKSMIKSLKNYIKPIIREKMSYTLNRNKVYTMYIH